MIRSATAKMSCRLCEIRTTASPCWARRATSSSTCSVCATPRAAVGSSRMTSAGVPHHGAGDRDRLALSAGERRDRLADGANRRDCEALHRLGRAPLHLGLLEPLEDVVGLAAEVHVLDDVEVVAQREILVDDLDPEVRRVLRAVDRDGLAVEDDLAAVGVVDAGDALDQRRLAGAVVTDERHHLTCSHLEVDLGECLDRAEVLRHSPELEEWFGGRCGGRCGGFGRGHGDR